MKYAKHTGDYDETCRACGSRVTAGLDCVACGEEGPPSVWVGDDEPKGARWRDLWVAMPNLSLGTVDLKSMNHDGEWERVGQVETDSLAFHLITRDGKIAEKGDAEG